MREQRAQELVEILGEPEPHEFTQAEFTQAGYIQGIFIYLELKDNLPYSGEL